MSRFIAALCILLGSGAAFAQTPNDGQPRDIVVSLYKLAVADLKGASPTSPFYDTAARAKYFSKDFDRRITAAETKVTADGDEFLDFDPISSSQDSELKKVSVKTVLTDAAKAVVAARFENHGHPAAVTYAIIAENGAWKIDDITGTVGQESWSVRKLLVDFDKADAK